MSRGRINLSAVRVSDLTSGRQELLSVLSFTHLRRSGTDICTNPSSATSPLTTPAADPTPAPVPLPALTDPGRLEEEGVEKEVEAEVEEAELVKQAPYVSSKYKRDSGSAVAACRLL